jgi:hypothetical protein
MNAVVRPEAARKNNELFGWHWLRQCSPLVIRALPALRCSRQTPVCRPPAAGWHWLCQCPQSTLGGTRSASVLSQPWVALALPVSSVNCGWHWLCQCPQSTLGGTGFASVLSQLWVALALPVSSVNCGWHWLCQCPQSTPTRISRDQTPAVIAQHLMPVRTRRVLQAQLATAKGGARGVEGR